MKKNENLCIRTLNVILKRTTYKKIWILKRTTYKKCKYFCHFNKLPPTIKPFIKIHILFFFFFGTKIHMLYVCFNQILLRNYKSMEFML